MPRLLPALLPLLLAGCLGAADLPAGDLAGSGAPPAGPLPSYLYACPGDEAGAEVCTTRIERGQSEIEEPFLAAHPGDANVLALGTNEAFTYAEMATRASPGEVPLCGLGIYTTKDAGVTWQATHLPVPKVTDLPTDAVTLSCPFDPALLFDAEGVLHVTAIIYGRLAFALLPTSPVAPEVLTYYARSRDLGATWDKVVFLSRPGTDTDRNWMARDAESGTIYVIWQNTSGPTREWTTEVAYTPDGGETWVNQDPAILPKCLTDGQPVVVSGELVFGCRDMQGPEPKVTFYTFDAATGKSTLRSEIAENGGWPLLAARGEDLLVSAVSFSTGDSFLARSRDGGRTWSEPVWLAEVLEADQVGTYWVEVDARGAWHLIVESFTVTRPTPLFDLGETSLWHLILDANGTLHQKTELLAPGEGGGMPRPTLPIFEGDHFYGIAPSGDRVMLAYTRDDGIEVGFTLPAS